MVDETLALQYPLILLVKQNDAVKGMSGFNSSQHMIERWRAFRSLFSGNSMRLKYPRVYAKSALFPPLKFTTVVG